MHLRRDPATAALLASLRLDGVRLAAYGQGPREASAVTLAFLGLDRRLDAIVLEPDGDGYAACLEALGVSEARHVSTREELGGALYVRRARRNASSSPERAIASTWSPGRTIVSGPAMSDAPARSTAIRRAPSGSGISDTLALRHVVTQLHLDDLEALAPQLEQRHELVVGQLVLDQAHDRRRRADRGRDPEQVEEVVVAGVVDARDHALDAVVLARDLAHDDVVLVVAGHGHDQLGTLDAAALEHHQLGRVAVLGDVLELLLEQAIASRATARSP